MSRKIISFILLVVIVCTFLCSCQPLVKLYYTETGDLTDGKITYKYAPSGYEPTFQGELYGVIKGTMEENVYKIGSASPLEWLTTEYAGLATLVYYNSELSLPTVSEMNPTLCYICEEEIASMSIYTVGDNDSKEEKAVIDYLISASLDENLEEEIWPRNDCEKVYHLKFYSDDFPAIYYNMIFAYNSSNHYLYDCVTKRCIAVDNVLAPYYENTYADN